MDARAGPIDRLTDRETEFMAARDSFYLASVSEQGWPYVQHRGGPTGLLRWIAGNRIGFADFRGNRQYLTVANLAADERVSLFLMDYPNRRRLKLLGRAHASEACEDIAAFAVPGYASDPERAILIDVIGFDWNCSQHITPRFSEPELAKRALPVNEELARLRARIAQLEGP